VDSSVTEITDETVDIPELLERLSRLKQIRPYPTWGRLADWQAHQLAHDAATSVGASGGPIFATSGLVIGLTTATVRDLDGAALGVPIRAALPLLGAREGQKRLAHTSSPARGSGR
jgi:S1-C subfamily serine protease